MEDYALRCEYRGGAEETGKFCRERDKAKEISKRCFSSASPQDLWRERLNKSTSIRKYMSDIAMEEMEREELKGRKPSVTEGTNSPQKMMQLREGEKSQEMLSVYDNVIEEKKEEHETDSRRRASTSVKPGDRRLRAKVIRNRKWQYNKMNRRDRTGSVTKGTEGESNGPRNEAKIYKKSLENFYFVTNSHPMREAREGRQREFWSQLDMSSTQILKQQLSHEHWRSEFGEGVGDVAQRLKEIRNVKTPIENFRQPHDFYKLAPERGIRTGTQSCLKRPRPLLKEL